ncbi:hypothetical protein PsYK624_105860 [Phanerochaete sordida]|uniref:Uncharacterized protein n=1 Tax=Phanerochaete sordida TaxID=48140 RepID=A0A9P3GEW3_9APHY|nr:hypothetical protein PsYK624_105860 [Phanerochaete sordida]
MLDISSFRAVSVQSAALLLVLAQCVSARSHTSHTSSSSPPQQCYDSHGNVIACKKSWIPIVVVLGILALIAPLAIWFWWRSKKRELAVNPKYEVVEESGASQNATMNPFDSSTAYDPAPGTQTFPAGYSPPTVGYSYKSEPDDASIKESEEAYYPLATFKPPPGPPPPVHAMPAPSYDPPAYAPSAAPV